MTYAHSDAGNAQLITDLFSNCLSYRSDTQEWLQWKKDHHWTILDSGDENHFAIEAAKYRYHIAANLDVEGQRKETSFALQSQNLSRITAAMTLAKTTLKSQSEWDSHPMLLPTSNGVVNLTNGCLRDGHPRDYITRYTSTPYIPEAECPRWLQFLDEVFEGDQDLIDYIQRIVGYSITGDTREQVFFILHGTGANGKSKFRNVLSAVLGNFAKAVRFTAFEEAQFGDAHRDLAELAGARSVFASEGSENKKLDTSVLKYITGEEPIQTSRKFGRPFSYTPQFKIWLSSNYLPKVDDNSPGFWRRVVVIPFNVRFEGNRRDPNLEAKLLKELPGILNWAITGAQIWFKHGLQTPDQLLLQVSKYKDAQDATARFIAEMCSIDSDLQVSASELYETYLRWCTFEDENPITNTAFGRRVSARFKKKKTSIGAFYLGLGVR